MGRSKKIEGLEHRIAIRISDKERKIMQNHADKHFRGKLSAYVRYILFELAPSLTNLNTERKRKI